MADNREYTMPRPLREGDTVAITAPASSVMREYVDGAVEVLRAQGWRVKVMPSAYGQWGSYSAPAGQRVDELNAMLADSEVRAIMAARGGYGTVQLLPCLDRDALRRDPKWIIGFSDISALHAVCDAERIMSIHGPMCKHLAETGGRDECSCDLFRLLRGHDITVQIGAHAYNHVGVARGRLRGGNMAVFTALAGTPFDVTAHDDTILVIEDIAEPIYKIERMLWQMRLSGALDRVRGVVVGQFTDCRPDRNYADMYDMIRDMLADCDVPVAFGAPVGHVDRNVPLPFGAMAELTVTDTGAALTTLMNTPK